MVFRELGFSGEFEFSPNVAINVARSKTIQLKREVMMQTEQDLHLQVLISVSLCWRQD